VEAEYVAYFDESGDHGLATIDPSFPAFVLCGCVYRIEEYLQADAPAFSRIKFATFGHDAVVMHSYRIRKRERPFDILKKAAMRTEFLDRISAFFDNSVVTLIAAAIRKDLHKAHCRLPDDPYGIALVFCLESLFGLLLDRKADLRTVYCVFEQRGPVEDRQLAETFRAVCDGGNMWKRKLPFGLVFASKQQNMPGLQIADLAAYPIARHVINAGAANPAYHFVARRFRTSTKGEIDGWGLKVFP